MYRTGHLGVTLLTFAPVGVTLVAAGAAGVALLAGAAMLWLAMLPDVDHRIPGLAHRGPTHSLSFATVVGVAFAGGAVAVGTVAGGLSPVVGVPFAVVAGAVGWLTVVAHLLGDVLTPAGVAFLWPVSDRRRSLSLWTADNAVANYGLFALGVAVTAGWVTFLLLGAGV
ncbi:MAG: metal-dependent hydrolase [Halolamina sp.]